MKGAIWKQNWNKKTNANNDPKTINISIRSDTYIAKIINSLSWCRLWLFLIHHSKWTLCDYWMDRSLLLKTFASNFWFVFFRSAFIFCSDWIYVRRHTNSSVDCWCIRDHANSNTRNLNRNGSLDRANNTIILLRLS